MTNYFSSNLSKLLVVVAVVAGVVTIQSNSGIVFGYGSSNNNNNNSTSMPSAPQCNDSKPGSAPSLISAYSAGPNSITLHWTKANGPVSYYLLTFGTKPGEQQYGSPNIGNADTTSFTITSLSGGKRYYFKVRAGNGCKPGDFSNEASAAVTGGFIASDVIPEGFAAGVLGVKTKITPTMAALVNPSVFQPEPTAKVLTMIPLDQPVHDSLWTKIVKFVKGALGL